MGLKTHFFNDSNVTLVEKMILCASQMVMATTKYLFWQVAFYHYSFLIMFSYKNTQYNIKLNKFWLWIAWSRTCLLYFLFCKQKFHRYQWKISHVFLFFVVFLPSFRGKEAIPKRQKVEFCYWQETSKTWRCIYLPAQKSDTQN